MATEGGEATNSLQLSSDEKEEIVSSAILLLVTLIVVSIAVGHVISKTCKFLNTSVIALALGFFTAIALSYNGTSKDVVIEHLITFNEQFFFIFILPPIIFASGYQLTGRTGRILFSRLGTVLFFAIFGTALAFAINSLVFWKFANVPFTKRQILALGSLLAPTDPTVGVNDMGHPVTESIIIGESLFNDSVALLIYRMVAHSTEDLSAASLIVKVFFCSMATGFLVGVVIATIIQFAHIRRKNYDNLETSITLLTPWLAYLIAEKFDFSGVVASLFCGIAMARYGIDKFGSSSSLFASISTLAETTTFVILGVSTYSFHLLDKDLFRLHCLTLLSVTASRFISVFTIAAILNFLLRSSISGRIPKKQQLVIAATGFRGATSVALSLKAAKDLGTGVAGKAIVATTLVYTLFTLIAVGPLLSIFQKEKVSSSQSPQGGGGEDTASSISNDGSSSTPSSSEEVLDRPLAIHVKQWNSLCAGLTYLDKVIKRITKLQWLEEYWLSNSTSLNGSTSLFLSTSSPTDSIAKPRNDMIRLSHVVSKNPRVCEFDSKFPICQKQIDVAELMVDQ